MIIGKFYELKEVADIFCRSFVCVATWARNGKIESGTFADTYAISSEHLKKFIERNPKYLIYISEEKKKKYELEF